MCTVTRLDRKKSGEPFIPVFYSRALKELILDCLENKLTSEQILSRPVCLRQLSKPATDWHHSISKYHEEFREIRHLDRMGRAEVVLVERLADKKQFAAKKFLQ